MKNDNNTNKNKNRNGFTIPKEDYEFIVKRGNEIIDEIFGDPLKIIKDLEKNKEKRES